MKKYQEIAECFEKAFDNISMPKPLAGAVKAMKFKPELCANIACFDDTLWLIVEEFLNNDGKVKDEDYFIRAVALLDCCT